MVIFKSHVLALELAPLALLEGSLCCTRHLGGPLSLRIASLAQAAVDKANIY